MFQTIFTKICILIVVEIMTVAMFLGT